MTSTTQKLVTWIAMGAIAFTAAKVFQIDSRVSHLESKLGVADRGLHHTPEAALANIGSFPVTNSSGMFDRLDEIDKRLKALEDKGVGWDGIESRVASTYLLRRAFESEFYRAFREHVAIALESRVFPSSTGERYTRAIVGRDYTLTGGGFDGGNARTVAALPNEENGQQLWRTEIDGGGDHKSFAVGARVTIQERH